ncbi:Alpha/Beta hydrolase protein [Mycena rebaudengoi]|nr:Alpha/Beta hydrolase protein [Mycena rebaudengoi]
MAGLSYSTCALPDVLGSSHVGEALPLVLVCGMASSRGDWIRLSATWAQTRPVLVYDHRCMGDSTGSVPGVTDEFTIETLARDLAFLIGHLQWPDVAILGFSMGGVVVQQMLVLPYHPTDPAPLPFRPTHVILGSTRSVVLTNPQHGLTTVPEPSVDQRTRTAADRYATIRKTVEATVDKTWLAANEKHMDFIIQRVISGSQRSLSTISRQKQALQMFDFADLLQYIPQELPILILHGEADQIIPFEYSQDMLRRIPSARFIEIGPEPGKLPTLTFGHQFSLYFPTAVWEGVINEFLKPPNAATDPIIP